MFSSAFYATGRRVYWARLVSFVGSAFTEFAIPLFLLKSSGQVYHVGLQWALIAVTRVFAGYLAPRLHFFKSDRNALATFDILLALAALLPVALMGTNVVLGCYLATLCTAFLATLQGGYIDSLVGDVSRMEEKREAARSWLLAKIENGRHLGMLVGYAAAYFVSAQLGFKAAFMIDSASFVGSALLLMSVSIVGLGKPRAIRASYSILLRPQLRLLTSSQILVGFGLYLYNALHVVVMKRDLGAGDGQLSLLYIFQYFGYFVGSRVPSRWVERTGRPLSDFTTVVFRLSVVLIYAAFALSTAPWMFIAVNTFFSFVIGVSFPGSVSLFQRAVDHSELRAAGAARLAITSFSGALGAATASLLLVHLPFGHIFLMGALVYLIAGFLLARYCAELPRLEQPQVNS